MPFFSNFLYVSALCLDTYLPSYLHCHHVWLEAHIRTGYKSEIILGTLVFFMIAFPTLMHFSTLYTYYILGKYIEYFSLWFTRPSLCLLGWWIICCDKWTCDIWVPKDNEHLALLGTCPTLLITWIYNLQCKGHTCDAFLSLTLSLCFFDTFMPV